MSMPTQAAFRLEAVRRFLDRGEIVAPMARLQLALFAPGEDERFVLSDHSVVVSNTYLSSLSRSQSLDGSV